MTTEPSLAIESWPLRLDGVSKRWQRDAPPVLSEVSLTLEPASSTWVGGVNGAGKTTLLRIAAGLFEPDAGSARVWGRTAREWPRRYRELVAFLPAGDRGLYARLSVRQHLTLQARLRMMPSKAVGPAIDALLMTFGLVGLADRRVDRVSMGQRQRVRLAMTFLGDPEVVLLDEPLTSLDDTGTACVRAALESLMSRDGAVLWCSPAAAHLPMRFGSAWTLSDGRLYPA